MSHFFAAISALLFFANSWAQSTPSLAPPSPIEIPIAITNQKTDITVHKNGTGEEVTEVEFEILSEQGRQALSLYPIQYRPSKESIEILSAFISTKGLVDRVPKKKIIDKSIANTKLGITDQRQITIPLEGLKVKSRITLRYKKRVKVPTLTNVFDLDSSFGALAPQKTASIKIKSAMPLYIQKNDPANSLVVVSSQEKQWHVIEVNLVKPVFSMLVAKAKSGQQIMPADIEAIPRIKISSLSTWNEFKSLIDANYQKRIAEPVSADIKKLIAQLQREKNLEDKIVKTRQWLKNNFVYSGRWTSGQADWIPRSINEIAGSKVGDCKDLSLLFVRILREVGLKADIAFVGVPSEDIEQMLAMSPIVVKAPMASLTYFNHAIARIELQGKEMFLDPTLPFTQGSRSDLHLHGKSYWYTGSNTGLKKIALTSDKSDIENNITKDIDGYSVKTRLKLRGSLASYLSSLKPDSDDFFKVATSLAGFSDAKKISLKVIDRKISPDDFYDIEVSYIDTKHFKKKESETVFAKLANMPVFYMNTIAKGIVPYSIEFPFELNVKTSVPGQYVNNETKKDCIALGMLANYRRMVQNNSQGYTITEGFQSVLDNTILDPANIQMVPYNQSDLVKCFANVSVESVAKNTADAKQVVFDDKIDPNPDLDEELIDSSNSTDFYLQQRRRLLVLIAKNPKEAKYFIKLGRTTRHLGMIHSDLYQTGFLNEARDWINKGLHIDNRNAEGWTSLGFTEYGRNDLARATSYANLGMKLNPKNSHAYYLAALIYEKSKNVKSAIEYYQLAEKHAATHRQKSIAILGQLGMICDNKICNPSARELAEKLLLTNPEDAWNIHNTSIYISYLGDYIRAAELERKALKKMNFGAARSNLVGILGNHFRKIRESESGDISTLGRLAEEAFALEPEKPQVLSIMFWYYHDKAKAENKPEYMQRAAVYLEKLRPSISAEEYKEYLVYLNWSNGQVVRQERVTSSEYNTKSAGYEEEAKLSRMDTQTPEAKIYDREATYAMTDAIEKAIIKCNLDDSVNYKAVVKIGSDGTIEDWTGELSNEDNTCIRSVMKGSKTVKPPKAPFRLIFDSE